MKHDKYALGRIIRVFFQKEVFIMSNAYENKNTFTGFKSIQAQISELTRELRQIGCCDNVVVYICSKFGIDKEYYEAWLSTGDIKDVAELVILYLGNIKDAILKEMREISTINA